MQKLAAAICLAALLLFGGLCSAAAAGTAEIISVDTATQGTWTYPENGTWQYAYGSSGYIIFFGTETALSGRPAVWAEHISELPDYAGVQTQGGFSYTVVQQDSKDPRALVMPQSEYRKAISCYSYGSCRLDIAITDGEKHLVTVYTAGFNTGKVQNRIELLDSAGQPAGEATVEKNGGTYVTVLADSSFSLILYDAENSSVGFQAVFFDELLDSAITDVTAAAKNRTVTLRWSGNADKKTAVYRKNGLYYQKIGETAGNTYTDENLRAGTRYDYKICTAEGHRISDFQACWAETEQYQKTQLTVLGPDTIQTGQIGEEITIRAAVTDNSGQPVETGSVSIEQNSSLDSGLYDRELAVCQLTEGGTLTYTYTAALFGTTTLSFSYSGDDQRKLAESSAAVQIVYQSPGWKKPPLVSKISEEISPGECFQIYGYGITGPVQVAAAPAAEQAPAWPPADAVLLETLHVDTSAFGNFVSAVLPAALEPGMYDVWVKNEYGWSNPIGLNAPIALFMDEYETAPGFSVKIVGRNLDSGQFGMEAAAGPRVRLVRENESYAAAVLSANRTCVEFSADGVPAGEYTVWVSNGGPVWGKLESGQTLTVLDSAQDPLDLEVVWAGKFNWSARYDARTDFGILPDTGTDQTAALQAAIDTVEKQGGGVLYIPSGEYRIKRLAIGTGVVLQGAGMEKTILVNEFGPEDSLNYILFLRDSAKQQGLIGIDSLGIRLARGEYMPDHFIALAGNGAGCDNIFVSRVGIVYPYATQRGVGNAVSLLGLGERVLIKDCYFDGYRAMVSSGYVQQYGKLTGNTFRTASGCCALFAKYSTIENNSLINPGAATGDYDDSQEIHGFSIKGNTYFAGNEVVLGLHMGKQGCGEVVMLEAPSAMYAGGKIASAGPDWAELLAAEHLITDGELAVPRPPYGELYLVITGGTGMGQARRVTGGSGQNRVLVERPWDVVPDETSQYSLGVYYENTTIYQNTAAQCEAGISFYSNCINCAALENTLSNTAGITNTAFHIPSACRVNANYFIRVEDNEIMDVLGISTVNGLSGFAYRAEQDTQLFGLTLKNNQVSNSVGANPVENGTALKTQGDFPSSRTCLGIIIEGNQYTGFQNGIWINAGTSGAVLKDNTFIDCSTEIMVNGAEVTQADGSQGGVITDGRQPSGQVLFYGEPKCVFTEAGASVLAAVKNDTARPAQGTVFLAVFAGDKCVGVYPKEITLGPEELKSELLFTVPAGKDTDTYRLMFWDTMMRPFTAPCIAYNPGA